MATPRTPRKFSDSKPYSKGERDSGGYAPRFAKRDDRSPSDYRGPKREDRKAGPSYRSDNKNNEFRGPSRDDRPRPNFSDRKPDFRGPSRDDRPRPNFSDRKPDFRGPNRDDRPRPNFSDRKPDFRGPSRDDRPRPNFSDRKPDFRGTREDRPRPDFSDRAPREDRSTPAYPERKIPEGANRLDEIKACGVNACRAIFKKRPNELVRAYVTEETMPNFADMLKFCAANKKAYHIVTSDDLNKISGSTHHEGVCVIAKAAPQNWNNLKERLGGNKDKPELLLILEDVGNSHNVGAIIRSAANFGIAAVLAPGHDSYKPSPSLLRTAEGGCEHVSVVSTPDLADLAQELKDLGFKILATAADAKTSIFDNQTITSRTALIIGNESRGISPTARRIAATTVAIPGTGNIDSLNVSAATAVLCAEFWRVHRA